MSVSRRDGDLIMGLINIILYLAFQRPTGPMEPRHLDVISQMPQSIREALSKFDLESRTVIYAACPKCHCTYKPRYNDGSTLAIYEETCTNRPKPEAGMCGEPLLHQVDDDGRRIMKPIKPFVYHDFHDYLASLLSRSDLEKAMDKSCDDLMRARNDPIPEFVTDVWEAEFLRTFEGPSSKTLFIDRQGEGRYGFTLNVDFFNIEGMNIHGRTTSCGIISMACLNLPYEIRYNPENMFIAGIIPGPHEPSTTDLNHYIKPLIDDLVVSWDNGVRYSRTALHPTGRITRSAIIAAVMDLPAARQTSQLASHSSHFYCSACQCFHRSTMGRTDHEEWVIRNVQDMRSSATKWLHAPTAKEREDIFKKHGTRWSELWRLSYWNPTRQLVVDAMHCILEGHAHHHFRVVLGLTSISAATLPPLEIAFSYKFKNIDIDDKPFPDDMNEKEIKQVSAIHVLLTAPLDGVNDSGAIVNQDDFQQSLNQLSKRLSSKNKKPLQFVCRDLECQPDPKPNPYHQSLAGSTRFNKTDWVETLVKWVGLTCIVIVFKITYISTAANEALYIRS
jgi:hypothetical protein